MYQALESFAPSGFAERYRYGSENWNDPEKMKELDRRINESGEACVSWLAGLQRRNRRYMLDSTFQQTPDDAAGFTHYAQCTNRSERAALVIVAGKRGGIW